MPLTPVRVSLHPVKRNTLIISHFVLREESTAVLVLNSHFQLNVAQFYDLSV